MPQQTLHDFVLTLLTDQKAMSAFQLDPQSVLDKAGLADITPQDVQEAIPLVMDYADSSLTGSFVLGLDGGAGSGTLSTPLGDFAAGLGVFVHGDGGAPAATLGLASPFGGVLASASKSGLHVVGASDFSALSDLGDTLDSDLLGSDITDADPTGALVDGLQTGAGLASDGITGSANGAASLLNAGASATAGLVGTGADLAAGALTDPLGTAKATAHTVTSVDSGTLPVDLPIDTVHELPVSIPVVDAGQPDHVVQDVVGKLPAGDLGDLPVQLPGGLPLDVDHTLDTVHEHVLDAVEEGAGSDTLQQAGVEDAISRSPLSDVLGQSPVSDVISLTQPGGATDLVGDVTSLGEQLPF